MTPHQTAPLPPMYQHAHVNAHTTTHNPFNDKHPHTRSSNNQDAPTAQHQRHQATTTNTPPQPTTPTTNTHDTSPPTTTTPTNIDPTTEHTPTTTQQPTTEAAANRHRNAEERPQTGPTPAGLSPGSGQRRRQAHRTNPQVRIGDSDGLTTGKTKTDGDSDGLTTRKTCAGGDSDGLTTRKTATIGDSDGLTTPKTPTSNPRGRTPAHKMQNPRSNGGTRRV